MNSSKPALKRPTKPSPFADLPFDSWPAVLSKTSEDPCCRSRSEPPTT
jgi:hypothetical protein